MYGSWYGSILFFPMVSKTFAPDYSKPGPRTALWVVLNIIFFGLCESFLCEISSAIAECYRLVWSLWCGCWLRFWVPLMRWGRMAGKITLIFLFKFNVRVCVTVTTGQVFSEEGDGWGDVRISSSQQIQVRSRAFLKLRSILVIILLLPQSTYVAQPWLRMFKLP